MHAESLEESVQQYDSVLKILLDKHAPEISKRVVERDSRPWMTNKIAQAKRKTRRVERRWRRTRLTVHREIYEAERQNVRDMINEGKKKCNKVPQHIPN